MSGAKVTLKPLSRSMPPTEDLVNPSSALLMSSDGCGGGVAEGSTVFTTNETVQRTIQRGISRIDTRGLQTHLSFGDSVSISERLMFQLLVNSTLSSNVIPERGETKGVDEGSVMNDEEQEDCSAPYWAEELVELRSIDNPSHPAFGQFGLFAKKTIPRRTIVTTYSGLIQPAMRNPSSTTYLMDFEGAGTISGGNSNENGLEIDAEYFGNFARFANDPRGITYLVMKDAAGEDSIEHSEESGIKVSQSSRPDQEENDSTDEGDVVPPRAVHEKSASRSSSTTIEEQQRWSERDAVANVTACSKMSRYGESFIALESTQIINEGEEILLSYGKGHNFHPQQLLDLDQALMTRHRSVDGILKTARTETVDMQNGKGIEFECTDCGSFSAFSPKLGIVGRCRNCGRHRDNFVRMRKERGSSRETQEKHDFQERRSLPVNFPFISWQVWDPRIPNTSSLLHSSLKHQTKSISVTEFSSTSAPSKSMITELSIPSSVGSRGGDEEPAAPIQGTEVKKTLKWKGVISLQKVKKGEEVGWVGGHICSPGDPWLQEHARCRLPTTNGGETVMMSDDGVQQINGLFLELPTHLVDQQHPNGEINPNNSSGISLKTLICKPLVNIQEVMNVAREEEDEEEVLNGDAYHLSDSSDDDEGVPQSEVPEGISAKGLRLLMIATNEFQYIRSSKRNEMDPSDHCSDSSSLTPSNVFAQLYRDGLGCLYIKVVAKRDIGAGEELVLGI